MKIFRVLFAGLLFISLQGRSQNGKANRIEAVTDSLRVAGNFPALYVHIIKDDKEYDAISGFSDKEKELAAEAGDRLLQGSVGKTYISAIALKLVQEKKLSLDDKISQWLEPNDWFARIPNANDITIRMLMNHTSGVMRYEFKPQFLADLTADPDKVWTPEDLLQYVLDEKPAFAAGEGWDYSDTNYILLGMIIELITGEKYYELLQREITEKFGLSHTAPSDKRVLPGLVQGYAGSQNEFGGRDQVVNTEGRFIINPQFEWTGGGVYATIGDLAKWGKLLYEGKVIDTSLLLKDPVAAKLGKDVNYAQGVIIRQTPLGKAYGHSGFFPGYMTELLYFPAQRLCIAVQTNSSDLNKLKIGLNKVLMTIANEVIR